MAHSLLTDIGGRDAVEAVVAMFYERVLQDRDLAPFFRGVSMPRLQTMQTDFFCAALSGQPWLGRDLRSVHAAMGITDYHFNRVASHLEDALRSAGVPAPKITEVLTLVETVRSQIVSDPSTTRHGAPAARGDEHDRVQPPVPARRNS